VSSRTQQVRDHHFKEIKFAESWEELQMHKKVFKPDNAAMLLIDHQLGTIYRFAN
jgi:hypothetical protein